MTGSNASMVKSLDMSGHLPTDRLRVAFAAVDRAAFIAERVWFGGDPDEGRDDAAVDRAVDPDTWVRAVYDPHMPIVTQWDDGAVVWPEVGRRPTSSCSAPTAVAHMLTALDPKPGDNVLEIGTGTGYNAALLGEVVGRRGEVTTVEVDVSVAFAARERLIDTGYEGSRGAGLANVRTLARDGATPISTALPWDRVIATAAVPVGRFPYTWVRQARPSAVILAPMCTDLMAGPLVRFVVGDDGVARGHAVPDVSVGFMKLRGERGGTARLNAVPWDDGTARRIDVDLVAPFMNPAWLLAIGLGMPTCRYNIWPADERSPHQLLIIQDAVTMAWASVHGPDAGGGFEVRQGGPRQLADELSAVLGWFAAQCGDDGEPPSWPEWLWEVGPNHQTVALQMDDGG